MNDQGVYKAGDVFTTTSIIPLMPEFDPVWSLWAINSIKYIPARTDCRVILSAKKGDIIWYRVEITNTLYKGDKGWINSICLRGQ